MSDVMSRVLSVNTGYSIWQILDNNGVISVVWGQISVKAFWRKLR